MPMSGRAFFAVILALTVVSCADPKYVSPNAAPNGGREQKAAVCEGKFASGRCVTITWERRPTEEDFGSFLFKTYRSNLADGTPVVEDLSAAIEVVLWMPSMGHGSSPVRVDRLDLGTYRASDVFFTMGGDWEMRFQLKDGDNVKDQAIVPISL